MDATEQALTADDGRVGYKPISSNVSDITAAYAAWAAKRSRPGAESMRQKIRAHVLEQRRKKNDGR